MATITLPYFENVDPYSAVAAGVYNNNGAWYIRETNGSTWVLVGPLEAVAASANNDESGSVSQDFLLKAIAVTQEPQLVKGLIDVKS